ncbi:MAG TPA: alcohol dehydrogenase catalytic domain-containing protein [Candidatus Binataceae bacterium]|jgi:(R,R)-butanediol dehydrogenase/meso-butanediol dehydrogenase/diacetyl reductase|nr:alcohol dehydrogenase catalytic domain-containing protein [Candidatus Binataceae bacterium]
MKAVVYQRPNELEVVDLPRPKAGAGEVVLKVHACGICGSDLHAVQHGFGLRPGSVMGHEFCGEIVELGPGVSGYAEGERVTSLPYIGCGTCEFCRKGQGIHCENIRGLGLGQLPGAYAEYVMCGARSLFKLPAGVDSRLGAMVEPLSVGLHGVKRAGLGRGASCVVMGAGPIGLATLVWCKARGASTILVSELAAGRAELARRLGATEVVNPTAKDPAERMRELTGRAPDLVFECIGVRSTLEAAIHMVSTLGRVVVLGVCMEPDQITPVSCIFKELSLDFVLGYNDADFQETIDALAAGAIDPRPMVTDVIGVEQVPEMFEALRKPGNRAKVIVEFP